MRGRIEPRAPLSPVRFLFCSRACRMYARDPNIPLVRPVPQRAQSESATGCCGPSESASAEPWCPCALFYLLTVVSTAVHLGPADRPGVPQVSDRVAALLVGEGARDRDAALHHDAAVAHAAARGHERVGKNTVQHGNGRGTEDGGGAKSSDHGNACWRWRQLRSLNRVFTLCVSLFCLLPFRSCSPQSLRAGYSRVASASGRVAVHLGVDLSASAAAPPGPEHQGYLLVAQ